MSNALSIIDYADDMILGPIRCYSCQDGREALIFNAIIFGIIGGIAGSIGAWFLINGHKETKVTPKQSL